MTSSPRETPAGRVIDPGAQLGPSKALSLEPPPMLRGGSKDKGGGTSPKGQVYEEVHSPQNPKGREEAVLPSLNPTKPNGESAHHESQFLVSLGPR